MAVTVVFGKAGSGKTARCLEEIRNWSAAGGKAILLVPDQATYSMERRFAAAMPGHGFMGTQIFGFSRLAFQVFQERNKEHASLSELSRNMILQRLLRQYSSSLTVLQTAASQPNFVTTMGQFLMECRSFRITPDMLRNAAGQMNHLTLSHKLEDIASLYEHYLNFLDSHFGNADDTMTLLAKELPGYTFIQRARVWVDGFQWFTPQQLQILLAAEKAADSLTVTLTMDAGHVSRQARNTALYHRPWEVYQSLLRIFPHLETENLPDPPCQGIQRFTQHFFQPVPDMQDTPVKELIVSECTSRTAEMDAIARRIVRLVQYGYRYRDFLILTRTSNMYDAMGERICRAYGIPCFTDYRRPMASHPAAEAVAAFLALLRSRWSHETVFRLLKTDLFPLDRHEVDILENYCLASGISSRQWLGSREWTYYPQRYMNDDTRQNPEIQERLKQINAVRQRVQQYILPFWQQAQGEKNLRDWCTLLYTFLQSIHVPDTLRRWKEDDESAGRTTESKEHEQVWKKMLAFMEEMSALCGDDVVSLEEFSQMVEDGMQTMTFSIIPPTLDHVTITSVERGYTSSGRIVFLCGINDGIFPQHSGDEGLLSDTERQSLTEAGVTLGPGSRFRSLQEKFLFYLAASRARERLYISYALADEQGEALTPSLWIQQLLDKKYISRLRKESGEASLSSAVEYIVSMPEALKYLPVMLRPAVENEPVDSVWWSLYDWAMLHGWKQEAVQAVLGLFYHNRPERLPYETVRRLYAPEGRIVGSITRFESYRQCPFAYFSQYGLGLAERPMQHFSAPDLGVLVHEALRRIGEKLLAEGRQWQHLQDEEIGPLCTSIVEELSPQIQNDILMSNAYFIQIRGRLIQVLIRTVHRLCDFNQTSDFHTAAVEKGFGQGKNAWKALQFTLENGLEVIVTGQIDRIDTLRADDTDFVVIIDYKSGNTVLDLQKIYMGLEVQLLTYMDVALKNIGPQSAPAAVLYCYVRSRKLSENRLLSREEKVQLYNKENKLKGFYLDSPDIVRYLDRSMETASSFLNVRLNKGGNLSTAGYNVFPYSWWQKVLTVAEKRIHAIAEQMGSGDISIHPVLFGAQSHCQYCPYHAFCAFDPHTQDNSYDAAGKLKKSDIVVRISQEGDDTHGMDS